MPWVNITAGKRLSAAEQEQVKAGLAKAMAELMNKQESGLVVTFTEAYAYYRAGTIATDAAIVDCRWIGTFPAEVKRALTRETAHLLAAAIAADPKKVTVVMSEIESQNWGRNAGDYS